MSLLAIPLILGAAYLVAFVAAWLVVEGADALGLVYSPAAEERRERKSSEKSDLADNPARLTVAIEPQPEHPGAITRRLEALDRTYARVPEPYGQPDS